MDHPPVKVTGVRLTLTGDSGEVLRIVQAAFNEAVTIHNDKCEGRDKFDLDGGMVFSFVPGEFWLGPRIGFEVTHE